MPRAWSVQFSDNSLKDTPDMNSSARAGAAAPALLYVDTSPSSTSSQTAGSGRPASSWKQSASVVYRSAEGSPPNEDTVHTLLFTPAEWDAKLRRRGTLSLTALRVLMS